MNLDAGGRSSDQTSTGSYLPGCSPEPVDDEPADNTIKAVGKG